MSLLGVMMFKVRNCIKNVRLKFIYRKLGELGDGSFLDLPINIYGNPGNIHLKANAHIYGYFKFISVRGHFYLGENSGAAQGLTVITDNHVHNVGISILDSYDIDKTTSYKDVVVEEDVWIGANVTLLSGVKIGRGASIGAGSVIRHDIPPYAIVVGNPGKILGFCFTPDEIIKHESILYNENNRLPLSLLENNYEKYFLKRLKEIKELSKL